MELAPQRRFGRSWSSSDTERSRSQLFGLVPYSFSNGIQGKFLLVVSNSINFTTIVSPHNRKILVWIRQMKMASLFTQMWTMLTRGRPWRPAFVVDLFDQLVSQILTVSSCKEFWIFVQSNQLQIKYSSDINVTFILDLYNENSTLIDLGWMSSLS